MFYVNTIRLLNPRGHPGTEEPKMGLIHDNGREPSSRTRQLTSEAKKRRSVL